jgi:hypothetical protein
MQTRFTIDYRSGEAAASRRILNRTLYSRGLRWLSAGAILGPAVLYVAFVFHANWTGWLGADTVTVIVGVGIVLLVYIRFAAPRINRRLFRRASGVAALEGRKVEYEFSDEGYRIRTDHFEGFQKWAGVDRIVERDGMVLIVLGPNANFLPARMFASAAERGEFILWVLARLTPEAREKSVTRRSFGKASSTG